MIRERPIIWTVILAAFLPCSSCLAAPRPVCEPTEQDFGTLENTQAVERIFRIWNSGDAPLHLGPIRPCLGVQIGLATNVVAPGTGTALTVTMPLRDCHGTQNKRIYIGTDDPQQPYLMVRLSGTVVTREDLLPLRIKPDRVDFGTISSRSVTGVTLSLTANTNAVFHISRVASTTSCLRAEWREVRTGSVAEVTLRAVPPLPVGRLDATLSIRTDISHYPNIVIPVSATVVPDLIAVPDVVAFAVAGGAARPETKKIVVRSRAGQAFKIVRVDPPLPNMEVSVAVATGVTRQAASTLNAPSTTNMVPLAAGYEITLHKVVFVREMDGKSVVITTDQSEGGTLDIPFRMQADTSKGKKGTEAIEEMPMDFLVK